MREEGVEPAGEGGGRKDAAHHVGFGQAGREEVLARGLVGDGAVAVFQVIVAGAGFDQFAELRVAGDAGVIQHEAHGEGGLIVLAGADGVVHFGQPAGDAGGDGAFEGREGGGPAARIGVVPFLEFGGELEQPGEAVGPLEGGAPFGIQVLHLDGDVGGGQALRQCAAGIGGEGRVREQTQGADQQPVSVDRGMPVVTAVEGRSELAGRFHVGVGIQGMGDFVGVFLMNAIERQAGETSGLGLIETGSRHENSLREENQNEKPGHPGILRCHERQMSGVEQV